MPTWVLVFVAALAALSGRAYAEDATEGPRLSLPRALLPLAAPAGLTLSVSGSRGCYSWSSSRDDVVTVVPIKIKGCSTSANILTAPNLMHRQSAIIFAEDIDTKQILRCDVMVDKISSLVVATTTRELFVEEAPVAFKVEALNEQGNKFTSLDGVEFSWTVVKTHASDIIRIITFAESSYTASNAIQELEAHGSQGDTVLLEGISTGSSKIRVKIQHSEYSTVKSVEVTIRVIANLLVVPPDVYIMLDDSVQFKIIQVREGRFIEFKGSPQYWLEIEDGSIADFNRDSGNAVGRRLGDTRIILKDADALDGESEAITLPEANLHVVTPYALRLELYPTPISRPWSVQCTDSVTIIVHILDKNGKRIHVGTETRVGIELDESLISVQWRSVNGTVLYGTAETSGVVPIVASLLSVSGKQIKPKITTKGEIHIFDKIEVIPPHVILPWDETYFVKSDYQLTAIGGDGSYIWRSDGSSSIDSQGLVTANRLGNASVVASMASNPRIFGTATVEVVNPISLDVIWYKKEGPVGSVLPVHIALYAESPLNSDSQIPYSSCNPRSFKISSLEGILFDVDEDHTVKSDELIGASCTILKIKCTEAGTGLLAIQYGRLQTGLSLSCYATLERVYPVSTQSAVLLTVGSTLNVIFKGGPISRYESGLDVRREYKTANQAIADVSMYSPLNDNSVHAYTVTCKDIGKTNFYLRLSTNSDEPSDSFLSEANVEIHCSKPNSIKLSPRQSIGTSCPTALSNQILVNGASPVEIEVIVFDNHGQRFHNASSMHVRWSAKPSAILSEVPPEFLLTRIGHISTVPIPDYHYQMLKIAGGDLFVKTNNIEVIIEAIGLRSNVLKSVGVSHDTTFKLHPRATLPLKVITPVQIPSDKIIVFNTPGVIVQIPLVHGSGSFKVAVSNQESANVFLDPPLSRNLKIQPALDGDISVAISDLCADLPPTLFQIRIVSVHSIVADIPELIEKGQTVSCEVRFYDHLDNELPAQITEAPLVLTRIIEGRVNVAPIKNTDVNSNALLYNVTGLETGDVRIEFYTSNVRTNAYTYVFGPLQLVPHASVLLPGGNVKLNVIGGPPPPATIKFGIGSRYSNIIDVNNAGVVSAINLGTGNVKACAEGFRGAELACDTAVVNVTTLEGITIHAPTTTLLIGNTMPLWAKGIPDSITPIELGALKPSLRFSWSVSGDGVGSITDVLSTTGLEFDDSDRVSVRFTAMQPGRIVINLNVTALPGSAMSRLCGHSWQAKIEVQAIKPLNIINPVVSNSHLLVAPYSSINLETNYNIDRVSYSIIEDGSRFSDNGAIIQVSNDGKLTTYGRLGFAIIMITTLDVHRQNISVVIEVCDPHYAMLELESNAYDYIAGLGKFPSGLNLPIVLSKFDVYGRKLVMSAQNVKSITNRPDLFYVSVNSSQNQLISLSGTGKGVMKVWNVATDKHFPDYLSLKVQVAILPQKIIATVGDVWCMRSAVKGGTWIENSGGALWIANDNMVQAHISKVAATSLVYRTADLSFSTQASVTTRSADVIYFLSTDVQHVVTDEKPYTVNVVLANHEESDKANNMIYDNRECFIDNLEFYPFTCEFKQSDASLTQLSIAPVFNKITGTYGCQITWNSDSSSPLTINSTDGLVIIARMGSISTEPLFVRMIKAALIQSATLTLSPPPASLAPLDITASQEVLKQIKIEADDDILSVQGPMHLSDTSVRYILRAKNVDAVALKSHVVLISALTHQNKEIPVIIHNGEFGGTCSTGGGSSVFNLLMNYQSILLVIVTFAVMLVVTAYVYGNVKYPIRIISMDKTQPGVTNMDNISFQSRSPLSRSPASMMSSSASFGPMNASSMNVSGSNIYGDPSYLAPVERRRTRQFIDLDQRQF